MKKILITQRVCKTSSNLKTANKSLNFCLEAGWTDFFLNLGCIPIPILSYDSISTLICELNPVGIILSGGNDLSAVNSNEENLLRDLIDKTALENTIQYSLPIIGICRGAQFIAKFFGLDIIRNPHAEIRKHEVNWIRNSRFTGENDLKPTHVNSFHNFSITGSSPSINILALSSEGNIEAFEHSQLNIFGMLWHPERCEKITDFDHRLFKSIFKI